MHGSKNNAMLLAPTSRPPLPSHSPEIKSQVPFSKTKRRPLKTISIGVLILGRLAETLRFLWKKENILKSA
jgi:hypothetical protein